jgi:outer membrane usher protein FimD/PapC
MTWEEDSAPTVTFTAMIFVLPKVKAGRSLSFIQSGDSTNSLSYVDKVDALGGIDLNLTGSNLMVGTTTGSSIGISGRKTEDWGEMALSADMDYGNPTIGTSGKFVATASTSLAFAGGYFAFTRQLDDSFVLFAPQKGMASQKVYFKVDGSGTVTSENGTPVILPISSYKTTAAYLEMPDASPDITPTVEAALLDPGYKSAILFTADTQKRYRVTGTLVNDKNVPYGYIAGDLVDAGGSNLNSTFTDETGQFELYDLEPGTYTILWPDFVGISKFAVTATESGIIELGPVVPAPIEGGTP